MAVAFSAQTGTAIRRSGLRLALVFATLIASLFVAHAIPDDRVADQLLDARESGEFSANNWTSNRPYDLQDKFADCLGLGMGLGEPGLFRSVALSDTIGKCSDANPALDTYAATGDLTSNWTYINYWHGYAVVTRPLVASIGVSATRALVTIAIAGAAAVLAIGAARRSRTPLAAVLVLPIVATTNLLWMAAALPTAIGAIAALAGPAIILFRTPSASLQPSDEVALLARVVLAGGLVAFFDLLSVGPVSWSFSVAAVGIVCARRMLLATGAWVLGYGGVWAFKWLLAASVLGVGPVWTRISDRVRFRLDGDNELVTDQLLASSRRTFDYWLEQPLAEETLVFLCLLVAGSAWINRGNLRLWLRRFGLLAAPALIVPLWCEVVRNHTQIHDWLTYRFWAAAAGIIAMAALVSLPATSLGERRQDSISNRRTRHDESGSDGPSLVVDVRVPKRVGDGKACGLSDNGGSTDVPLP